RGENHGRTSDVWNARTTPPHSNRRVRRMPVVANRTRARSTSSAPNVAFSTVGDAELAAFRRRDPNAVRALYRQYGGLMYAVAYRVLGRHDLAEEATQQAFVRAWQGAERFDVDRDPAPWLATIARRTAIDVHRGEARRSAGALSDVALDDPAVVTLPPDLDTLDAVWNVRRAIGELPPEEAAVVRLHHLDGMTHNEI